MKAWRTRVGAALAVVGAASIAAMGAATARADDGAWKAAHDTDPHVPLTALQKQKLAEKQQHVATFLSQATGRPVTFEAAGAAGTEAISPLNLAPSTQVSPMLPTSSSVLANQIAQERGYWCGPASVQEALGQFGISRTQSTLASQLGTTSDGTAWSGGSTSTGHPIPDVLNSYGVGIWYIPWEVPAPFTKADYDNYVSFLLTDIASYRGPLIGDAWETPSSTYHLVGHPADRTIFHWFDIRGYTLNGGNTMYEDSVHNATSVSWYASVPAYSTIQSIKIVSIVGGRGYVW